jgi:hypothetical protein
MNADGTLPGFHVSATGPVRATSDAERWTDLRLYSKQLDALGFVAGVIEGPGDRYLAVFDRQVQTAPDFATFGEAFGRVRELQTRASRARDARQATIRG